MYCKSVDVLSGDKSAANGRQKLLERGGQCRDLGRHFRPISDVVFGIAAQPPLAGGGLVQDLVLLREPVPQETEQVLQLPQPDHWPLTGTDEAEQEKMIKIKKIRVILNCVAPTAVVAGCRADLLEPRVP